MPRPRTRRAAARKSVEMIAHEDATRRNLPSAEHQPLLRDEENSPIQIAYQRRNRDLDPQLVWRGKDEQDLYDLAVNAPPLYIQERVHPKALVDDLVRQSRQTRDTGVEGYQHDFADLFADFNGLPSEAAKTEFYRHDAHWSNRMILGDSLQVMASMAEREGLRGQVQCIYIDPPYGIRFNSNFQWSTTSRDVRDGNRDHITREPEQVRAFRDTWRDGIHSYLSYLRDRLTIARDLLADSGSIFVQIGDENVHRVRALMDEVFGDSQALAQISFVTTGGQTSQGLPSVTDHVLWYGKNAATARANKLLASRGGPDTLPDTLIWYQMDPDKLVAQPLTRDQIRNARNLSGNPFWLADLLSRSGGSTTQYLVTHGGKSISPHRGGWRTSKVGMERLIKADRIQWKGHVILFRRFRDDFWQSELNSLWTDTQQGGFRQSDKIYVVQTNQKVVERCLMLATNPGDLVLDPTCGSGTTAYVAEQWGRRWVTIDTSRVALALARARIMGARYPYYLLADSRDGQLKEAELSRRAPSEMPTYANVRQGFVYERVPHITLRAIANNTEIDVIYENFEEKLEPLRHGLNRSLDTAWEEWEIPRDPDDSWSEEARSLHHQWWDLRIARQKEIDASIAAQADYEYLYDKPYEDRTKVRVAGPFTVESISPHRVLGVDENGEVLDTVAESRNGYGTGYDFGQIILDNLKRSGVQQAHREDRISFASLTPWPGRLVCAEGRYIEGASGDDDEAATGPEKKAGIFIGPEFGTVSRPDLVEAAREAAECGFDVLIACAFNYDAHTTEFESLGRIPVLKARMNADLHMAGDLKNTGTGNLFVIFGEPDIDVLEAGDNQIQVKVNGVDVFDPSTGEVRSDGPDGIACWFIDTDYNQESFFVRHAYFLGASDPYRSLKTTLKAEIDPDAWATLHSDTSRPFPKPQTGRIAVKIINHLGDEVLKVFRVG